jgi:hypothetical protein
MTQFLQLLSCSVAAFRVPYSGKCREDVPPDKYSVSNLHTRFVPFIAILTSTDLKFGLRYDAGPFFWTINFVTAAAGPSSEWLCSW